MSFADISALTDRQIYDLYYRERDKDGSPKPIDDPEAEWQRKEAADGPGEDPQAAYANYLSMAAAFGMDMAAARQKWEEAKAKHGT